MNKSPLSKNIEEMFDTENRVDVTSEMDKGCIVCVVVSLSMSIIIICSLVYSLLIAIN